MVAFPLCVGNLGQRLFPVDFTVGTIQVPVQLAPFFLGQPALMALFMLAPVVALAPQRLARGLLYLAPALLLQPRAEARTQIACLRKHWHEQRNCYNHQ